MSPSDPFTPSRRLILETIDSTNAEALRRAMGGERGPLWITAREQTAGRGRSGRAWLAPAGTLAASLLMAPGCRMEDLHQLAFVTGVAVHEAIGRAAGQAVGGLRLKWPNDILIGGAKAGGILIETTSAGRDVVAVAGIGLNVAANPHVEGRAVTHIAAHAPGIDVDGLLDALDGAMQRWLAVWQGGAGFAHVRSAWMGRTGAPGEAIFVNAGVERIDGTFLGIDGSGALLLRDPGGSIRRVTYGDVSLDNGSGHAPERTIR